MKKIVVFLLLSLFCLRIACGQDSSPLYTCEKLVNDIKKWNEYNDIPSNIKRAQVLMENKLYQQGSDGSIEYVYIMKCNDSIDVASLRRVGFNFINHIFPKIDNALRADMETNSPSDGVIFKGTFTELGEFHSLVTYNRINGNVLFDIRFKPDRVRFSIKVLSYQVLQIADGMITQNYTEYVKNSFPFNPESGHKKSYAMAFINANSYCMNFASAFHKYLCKHAKETEQTEIGDW